MIFVTVGNANQGFKRLLDAVDEMAGLGVFDEEEVIIQSGNNIDFKPRYSKNVPFISMDEFAKMIKKSNLVICHAGAGTLINVLKAGKVPVVMARRKKYGEHVDDHQVELVEALDAEGKIIAISNRDDLERAFKMLIRKKNNIKKIMSPPMLAIVEEAILNLVGASK